MTNSRYLCGSYLKTVVGGRKFAFNMEKCIPLKAFYSPLWQSRQVSSYPVWCWNCSPKEIICSKENVTATSHKTGKNFKFLQNWWGEVSDSPDVPWDGSWDQHHESLSINISCFSTACLPHQVLSYLHRLTHPRMLGLFFSQKPLTTVTLLSGQLYIQPPAYRILNLSFQILVEPLARLWDTRKNTIFWIQLDIHIYPGQPQNDIRACLQSWEGNGAAL